MYYCLRCGTSVKREDKYCRNCSVILKKYRSEDHFQNRWHYYVIRLIDGFLNTNHRMWGDELEEDNLLRRKKVGKCRQDGTWGDDYLKKVKLSWSDFEYDLQREIIIDCRKHISSIKRIIQGCKKGEFEDKSKDKIRLGLQDIKLQLSYLDRWLEKLGIYNRFDDSINYLGSAITKIGTMNRKNESKVINYLEQISVKLDNVTKGLKEVLYKLNKED